MALALALCAGGCATLQPPAPLEPEEAEYTRIFPYYAEACAVSQIKKKPGFGAEIRGGPGGHAVMYLNGVCLDRTGGSTKVALCEGVPGPGDGVGLSVNAHYKNANWVAIEGRDFFMRGGIALGQRLTRLAYQRAQTRAQTIGIFKDVEFHDAAFEGMPAGTSKDAWKYEVSIGTDYAIEFARHRFCARVPLDRVRMSRIVNYLNELNEPYVSGRSTFKWNVLQNNCSHLIHNALSAAGVWGEWETNQSLVAAALDFPVPRNEFVNLVERTNDLPLDDILELFRDRDARDAVVKYGVLPNGPGALAESHSVILDNDVYDTDLSLIFYDEPLVGRYARRFAEIFGSPRYFDLKANLRHFQAEYARLRDGAGLASLLATHPGWSLHERALFSQFFFRVHELAAQAAQTASGALMGQESP